MEYGSDRTFPLLWDFPLAPDEGGKPMELQQDGPVLVKSEFQQFRGKAIRPHSFRVCYCTVVVVVTVSHIQRIGCQPESATLHGG